VVITIGQRLGTYEITALLGKGGMGEVYRARDTKLKRDVAIKILPGEFSRDADRVSRFQREAEVLASLNHPNVAAIYDLQEADGSRYLVLELVEGETLADRIARGPIPVEEALDIAKNICEALEAAHEKGIIHRDLKPANVKITPEGRVKVLDFGLAKIFSDEAANVSVSQSPTLISAASTPGIILGTAAYMSPEQARGTTVDKRTDIWAYGCVLYEMLAGQPAFSGSDVADILAAVLRAQPQWSALPPDLGARVRESVERCLQKNPLERWRDIGDVGLQIRSALADNGGRLGQAVGAGRSSRSVHTTLLAVAFTFCLTLILVAGVAWLVWPRGQVSSPVRLEVSLPPDVRPAEMALSPDGRRLAFVANGRMYTRALDEAQVRSVPGTEGAIDGGFFSPDGQWLAFFTNDQLKKVALNGGAAISLANVSDGLSGTWAPGDRIFFGVAGPSGLFQLSAGGGMPESAAKLESYQDLDYPEVLPGGEWLLFSAQRNSAVSIQFDILAQSLVTGERKVVLKGGKFARYSSTGHLIYEQLGSLYAVTFDAVKVSVTGPPTPLGEHVATDISFFSPVLFALARNGTLAFVPGRDASKRHLVWVDRTGHAEPLKSLPQRAYAAPRLAPDAQRIMTLFEDTGDLWIFDMRGSSIRLTKDGLSVRAVWSADSSQVAYSSGRVNRAEPGPAIFQETAGAIWSVFSTPSDGGGEGSEITNSNSKETVTLAAQVVRAESVSPDGRWAAYVSNESGRDEVYVRPHPGPGGKFPVSTSGGIQPAWGRNGELFYRNGDRMMAVPVSTMPTLKIGQPKVLFEGDYELGPGGPRTNSNYDVTPDGQRFLMVAPESTADTGQPAFRPNINIVLNWFEELKRRVPVH